MGVAGCVPEQDTSMSAGGVLEKDKDRCPRGKDSRKNGLRSLVALLKTRAAEIAPAAKSSQKFGRRRGERMMNHRFV